MNKNGNQPNENMIDEGLFDNFSNNDQMDPNEEKIKEMNKKLPSWSLEPPKGIIKK